MENVKFTRRHLLAAGASLAAIAAPPASASLDAPLPAKFMPQDVKVPTTLLVGSIYVSNADHHLFHIIHPGIARRYGVALGAVGRKFEGSAMISRKAKWPSWTPTRSMIAKEPDVYGPYASGLPGGHSMNPMGSRALYLQVNGRETYFRIHGTNLPNSIGRSFSSGCIRLRNDHIEALYDNVPVGTVVHAY